MKIIPVLLIAIGIMSFSCKQQDPINEDQLEVAQKVDTSQKFLMPTQETWNGIQETFKGRGKIAMLNLLRFKSIADYTGIEVSDVQEGKTGKETYQHYIKLVENILEGAKQGRILYFGQSQDFLIGPQNKKWDAVILVEYESVEDFVNFIQSDAYQQIAGHRAASLEDTRLLPTSAFKPFSVQK